MPTDAAATSLPAPLRGPLVGASAIVVRDGRVLLGRRRGAHGAGTWSFPGGKVDAGEAPASAVARELAEETGLIARTVVNLTWTDDVFADDGLHYVTLHHVVDASGEPERREPDKVDDWSWHSWDALPEPLFAPVASLVATGWRPPVTRDGSGPEPTAWITSLPLAADLRAALDFLSESHDLAYVMRLNRLRDGSRPESSAEHSWHLALCAVVLARQVAADVDLGRVLTMLLIHDLVEIEAGDVPIYDLEARAAVALLEERAAERIFGLLPGMEAAAFLAAWQEFEVAVTEEARFARALDRLQPMLLHAAGDGSAWAGRGVTVAQEQILVSQVGEFWPALGLIAEAILDDAARRGWLAAG